MEQRWACTPDADKPIHFEESGPASKEGFQPITVPQVFENLVAIKGDKPALAVERGIELNIEKLPVVDGVFQAPPSLELKDWTTWSYAEYFEDAKKVAKALIAAGLQPYDAVNLFGSNAPEWNLSSIGAILAGGICAGIYPTDTGDQIRFKVDHANGAVVVVDSEKNFKKVKEVAKDLPYLKAIVCWGELNDKDAIVKANGENVLVFSWDEFLHSGSEVSDETLQERMRNQKPEKACFYVYTSGTTGNPKAVMLSHDNIVFMTYVISTECAGSEYMNKADQERTLSYLPLSHVAGMMLDIFLPIVSTLYTKSWETAYFARPYDLKTGMLVARMQIVKPTIFLGVPRVWEKMAAKLKMVLGEATGIKGSLTKWAMQQGSSWAESTNFDHSKAKQSVPGKGMKYWLADKLVLKKVRAKLGLEEAKHCFSGAAPLPLDVQRYIGSFGIIINEVYAMSEGTAGGTWSTAGLHLFGSCGPSLPCIESKIFHVDPNDINKKTEVPRAKNVFAATEEEQGEVCTRGRTVMIGYMANPRLGEEHVEEVKKKNMETVDNEGWIHTGDKGAKSEGGFFKITGRYKELIITAGGENIAPVPIEDEFKANCPIVSNFVMIGDKRKFNVALVTLKLEGATGEFGGSNKLVASEFEKRGFASKTIEEAMKDEKIIAEITAKINELNSNGKVVVSNAAKIQKFMILPRDLSISTGEFTPTLKLKRGFLTQKFSDVLDVVYASSDVYVEFPMEKYSTFFSN